MNKRDEFVEHVMLLRNKPVEAKKDAVFNHKYFDVEDKADGHRATVIRMPNEIIVLSRKKDVQLQDAMPPRFINLVAKLPDWTALDGEVFVLGKPASYVPTALRLKDGQLRFIAFGCPFFDGENQLNLPIDYHRGQLKRFGFNRTLRRGLVDLLPLDKVEAGETHLTLAELKQAARELIVEGFVVKEKHRYGGLWWKVKPTRTIDAFVTDWKLGNGKHIGLVGAFTVSVNDGDKVVDVASVGNGFQDPEREELNGDECIGRVMEVEYDSIMSKGRLRFPRFLRWRDDKCRHECSIEQIRALHGGLTRE